MWCPLSSERYTVYAITFNSKTPHKMKKPILIIGVIALMLTSCEKKSCWKCTIKAYVSIRGQLTTSTSTNSVCDKTSKEIRDYEKQASTQTTSGSGSNAVKTTTTANCSNQ